MTPPLAYDMYCIVRVTYNIVHIVHAYLGLDGILSGFYRLSPSHFFVLCMSVLPSKHRLQFQILKLQRLVHVHDNDRETGLLFT
jgi:hypothetical protein